MSPVTKAERLKALTAARETAGTESAPRVLILVGIPVSDVKGSGKSTFAEQLVDAAWGFRISQDELGNRKACELAMFTRLQAGQSVIIDRCNFDEEQRKHWIDYAKARGCRYGVIVFATDLSACLKRVRDRSDHPTLRGSDQSDGVVFRMADSFVFPKKGEGYLFCRIVKTPGDSNRVFQELTSLHSTACSK